MRKIRAQFLRNIYQERNDKFLHDRGVEKKFFRNQLKNVNQDKTKMKIQISNAARKKISVSLPKFSWDQ